MSDATAMATFVVMFREALEAGLIVGIIFTMLSRLNAMRYAGAVWASIAAAVVASFAAGWGLSLLTSSVQDRWGEVLEGLISVLACGVLTYMVFWMDRQSKLIRPHLEGQVADAVARQALPALVALPFLAVLREGAESVLFLKAVAIQGSGSASLAGGLAGVGAALAVTAAVFLAGRRVPLKPLFQATGGLLLVVAAGMLAYGLHELQEAGWAPTLIDHVWDINHILDEKQGAGAFLKALFGYNGNPSLLEVLAYIAYLAGVLFCLKRVNRPEPAR